MEDAREDVEENLHGCYLLYCCNQKYKGHTYIGYSVNPSRRIKQHNGGIKANGAKRTNNKGPWEMALLIYGFLNSTSALKFEWAWQNPKRSRRLKHVRCKKSRETAFEYKFYIVSVMLRTGPWNRLPLIIRWLKQTYLIHFDPSLRPPPHMPIVYGPIVTKKVLNDHQLISSSKINCHLCHTLIEDEKDATGCINPNCPLSAHVVCLAELFTEHGVILPIEGTCPNCETNILWGDLIRKKMGCHKTLSIECMDLEN